MNKIGELIVKIGTNNDDLTKGLKRARTDLEKFTASANVVGNTMIGVGAAATAAMGGAIASAKNWAAAVNDLEDKTGMAGETASVLLYQTQAVGLAMNDAGDCMAKMSKSVMTAYQAQQQAAAAGRESTDVYTKYGVAITDANGKLLDAESILKNVAARHREMANGVEKTAMEMEMFGRSGAKLNDLLNLSQEELDGMAQEAKDCGLIMGHNVTQAWEDMTIQMNKSRMAMIGAGAQIGNALLPDLQTLAGWLQTAAKKFNGMSDTEKKAIVKTLETAGAIGALGLGLRGALYAVGPFVEGINAVITAFRGMEAAAIAARAAALGAIAVAAVAGVAIYQTLQEKEVYDKYGSDAFEIDGDVVQVKKGYVEKKHKEEAEARKKKLEEAQQNRYDEMLKKQEEALGVNKVPSYGGGGGGGGAHYSGGGGKSSFNAEAEEAKRKAEELKRKIEEVTKAIQEQDKDAQELGKNFGRAGIELSESMLEGSAKVDAELKAIERRRMDELDDYSEKYKKEVEEAKQIVKDAEATKNAEVMKMAKEHLQMRIDAAKEAEERIAEARLKVHEDTEKKMTSTSIRQKEIQADLEMAMREGDVSAYMQVMDEKNARFLADLAEKQATMQQYYQWQMDSEQGLQEFKLKAMEDFRNGMSDAIAGMIVGGKNIMDSISNITKSIIAMYIKMRAQQMISHLLAKKMQVASTASTVAQAAVAKAAWMPAAMAASIATSGGASTAGAASFTAALSTANAVGNASASFFGGPKFADGGFVTRPKLSLIGEGKHHEGVFPLSQDTFRKFSKGIVEEGGLGGGQVVINVTAPLDGQRAVTEYFKAHGHEITEALGSANGIDVKFGGALT